MHKSKREIPSRIYGGKIYGKAKKDNTPDQNQLLFQ